MEQIVAAELRRRYADCPETASARVKALRQPFAWAIDIGRANHNPARDVPRIRTGSEGFHTWPHGPWRGSTIRDSGGRLAPGKALRRFQCLGLPPAVHEPVGLDRSLLTFPSTALARRHLKAMPDRLINGKI